MFDRLTSFFAGLPLAARIGIPAILGLFILALAVGLATRPSATLATVSTVRPAASPASVSVASSAVPASVLAPAAATAAPPAPQMGAGARGAAVVRPAMPPQVLRDCAREVLGLTQSNNESLNAAVFTPAAEREDCKSPFATVSSHPHQDFASYAPGRGHLQVTRSGIYAAERAGEFTFVLSSPQGAPRRCALYVGDLSAPLAEADSWRDQFAVPAVAALEAGQHEIALVCGFTLANSTTGGASVTASVRAPGEATPSLLKLGLPEPAAQAVGTAATPAATPAQAPAK